MLTDQVARIARETLVDVATPAGDVGVIEYVSTRSGVKGAQIDVANPLGESGWYPLADLDLCASSRVVVARYL